MNLLMQINSYEEQLRKDIAYAEEQGWKNTSDWYSRKFEKGDVRIWEIRDGWQVADLIFAGATNNIGEPTKSYRNHRPVKTLREAIEQES